MKRLFLFGFILCCHAALVSAQVSIIGQVKDAQPARVYLLIQNGEKAAAVDSTELSKTGTFTFNLGADYRHGVYKLRMGAYNEATLIVGKEKKISIETTYADFQRGVIRALSSKENDAFAVLTNFFNLYSAEVDSLQALQRQVARFDPQHDAKTKELKKAFSVSVIRFNNSVRIIPTMFSGTFTAEVLCPLYLVSEKSEFDFGKDYDTDEAFQHAHFFAYVDFADPRIINTATYEKKLFTYLDLYVEHTEDGFMKGVDNIMKGSKMNDKVRDFTVAYLLEIFTSKGPPNLVEYVHDNYSQNCELPMLSETEKLLNKLKEVGKGNPAPELVINDINYSPVSLKNTLKGKVGMIYFWASTCPHCMEHTPKVFEVYKKYKDKGFEVYSVSLDTDYSAWLKAIQDMKVEWMNVSDLQGWKSSVISTYTLERTPTIFLVDKQGKIIEKNFAPADLEDKLKKYLN